MRESDSDDEQMRRGESEEESEGIVDSWICVDNDGDWSEFRHRLVDALGSRRGRGGREGKRGGKR